MASAVVIVLALAAVSGVTYSWFSDSDEGEITINTAKIDIEVSFDKNDFEARDRITIDDWLGQTEYMGFFIKNSSTTDIMYRTIIEAFSTSANIDGLEHVTVNGNNAFTNNGNEYTSTPVKQDWVNCTYDGSEQILESGFTLDFDGTGDLDGAVLTIKVSAEAYPASYIQESTTSTDINTGVTTATLNSSDSTVNGLSVQAPIGDGEVNIVFSKDASADFNNTVITIKEVNENGSGIQVDSGDSFIKAFDVEFTGAGMANGTDAEVTFTVPGIVNNPVVYHVDDESNKTECQSTHVYTSDSTIITFTASEFSAYCIIDDMISDADEIDKALKNGVTELNLPEGTFQIPSSAKGKTLTITGSGPETIIEVIPAGQGEANGQLDYNFDGSTVTFNNLTIKTNSQTYAGYARLSGTYNNCVIQNTYNLGTGNSAFYNCEFKITNEYLRVGGAYSAVFDNCIFDTEGRAILIFQDGTSVDQTVTVKDCTFNATAPAHTWNGIHVSAVSMDGSQGGKYIVNLEGNNVVDADFSGLSQIKAGGENITVNNGSSN